MFFYLLFFFLLSESMATDDSTSMSNKILCYYAPDKSDPSLTYLDATKIPGECDAILYGSFLINQSSMIDVNEELLESVIALNKPVIVALTRTEYYSGWSAILNENGNADETKILGDFAKQHNIQGYSIDNLEPSVDDAVDKKVAKNIIAYINQLKAERPSLIIGASIYPFPEQLNNKDIYNFEELNNVLTYFDINAMVLNTCNPKLYNGLTPITKSEPGDNYLYSLEEVVSNLKEIQIDFAKLVITISLFTTENKNDTVPSYSDMCNKGLFDNSSWCVQTSQNYYDKGKYIRENQVGIGIIGVEKDDYSNVCECKSAFNGFYNIRAGYKSGNVIPCSKFDVQSTVYPIK